MPCRKTDANCVSHWPGSARNPRPTPDRGHQSQGDTVTSRPGRRLTSYGPVLRWRLRQVLGGVADVLTFHSTTCSARPRQHGRRRPPDAHQPQAGLTKTHLTRAVDAAGIAYTHLRAPGNPKDNRALLRDGRVSEGERASVACCTPMRGPRNTSHPNERPLITLGITAEVTGIVSGATHPGTARGPHAPDPQRAAADRARLGGPGVSRRSLAGQHIQGQRSGTAESRTHQNHQTPRTLERQPHRQRAAASHRPRQLPRRAERCTTRAAQPQAGTATPQDRTQGPYELHRPTPRRTGRERRLPHQAHRTRPTRSELDITGEHRPQVRQDPAHTRALRIPHPPRLRNQTRRHPHLASRRTHPAPRSGQTYQTPLPCGRPSTTATAHGAHQIHPRPSPAHHPGPHHRHRVTRP